MICVNGDTKLVWCGKNLSTDTARQLDMENTLLKKQRGNKMNDRFKFRVWDIRNGEYFKDPNPTPPLNCDGTLGFTYDKANFQKHYIVEQCTGLSDKNGNLIYEGDLIKSPNNSHKLAVVRIENGVYGCKEFRFNGVWEMNLYDLIKHYGVEIIGNIHEQA